MSKVWVFFFDLTSTRTVGPSGPNPISYTEIKAYLELSGTTLTPMEVGALKRLDNTYLKVAYSE